MFAFMVLFLFVYLFATEFNSATSSTAEVLVFRRGHVPNHLVAAEKAEKHDEEAPIAGIGTGSVGKNDADHEKGQEEKLNASPHQTDMLTWKDVCYDIKTKGEPRRLLHNVSRWVKPITWTALTSVSGAGKITLLDSVFSSVTVYGVY
jgi:ABC-type multidrug transport system fused ATPase/permease subunit